LKGIKTLNSDQLVVGRKLDYRELEGKSEHKDQQNNRRREKG